MIHEIARAYHCPHWVAVGLFHRDSAISRCIQRLGPMRVHWQRGPGQGWRLYNKPITSDVLSHIQKEFEA